MEKMSRDAFGMSDSLSEVEATLNSTTDATVGLDESIQKLSGSMRKDIPAGTKVVIDGLNNQIQHADNYIDRLEKIKTYYQVLSNAGIVGKDFSIGGSAPVSIGTGVGVGYTSGGGIIPTGTGGGIQTGVGVSTGTGGGSQSVVNGVPVNAVPESQPTATMNLSKGRGNNVLLQEEQKLKLQTYPTGQELQDTIVYDQFSEEGTVIEHLTNKKQKILFDKYRQLEKDKIIEAVLTSGRIGERGLGANVSELEGMDKLNKMMDEEMEMELYLISEEKLPEDITAKQITNIDKILK